MKCKCLTCFCYFPVGISGHATLVVHALLNVWVLVHQHHSHLFPWAGPYLACFSFKSYKVSVDCDLPRIAFYSIWEQLHLERVPLLRSKWWTVDRLLCGGGSHQFTEVLYTPHELWAGCLRNVYVIQWESPSLCRPSPFLGPLKYNTKFSFNVQTDMMELPQPLRSSC